MRKSAQKKIGRGQHMSSLCMTPHKLTVQTKQIESLPQLWHGVACSCMCKHVTLYNVCAYKLTPVMCNSTQVKKGQNSRRAA